MSLLAGTESGREFDLLTSTVTECFLCSPDEALVYAADQYGLALCGLGPLVPAYSLVASREHVRSAADFTNDQMEGFVAFASRVRKVLISRYSTCLLTEHGRLPACIGPETSVDSDPHCYHAHLLLFPGAPELEQRARSHFKQVEENRSFHEALIAARAYDEYFLFSPSPERFLIMSRPGRLIRQFARLLVAEALGNPELANWRRHSGYQEALKCAAELRSSFAPGAQER